MAGALREGTARKACDTSRNAADFCGLAATGAVLSCDGSVIRFCVKAPSDREGMFATAGSRFRSVAKSEGLIEKGAVGRNGVSLLVSTPARCN